MVQACESLLSSARISSEGINSTPTLRVDSVLEAEKITLSTLSEIESLRPFGIGFPSPVFLLRDVSAPVRPLGQTGEHIRWDIPGKLEIIGFRMGEYSDIFS